MFLSFFLFLIFFFSYSRGQIWLLFFSNRLPRYQELNFNKLVFQACVLEVLSFIVLGLINIYFKYLAIVSIFLLFLSNIHIWSIFWNYFEGSRATSSHWKWLIIDYQNNGKYTYFQTTYFYLFIIATWFVSAVIRVSDWVYFLMLIFWRYIIAFVLLQVFPLNTTFNNILDLFHPFLLENVFFMAFRERKNGR